MDADVLVAGAGPTGLTLALDLARRGIRVRIVEKADRYSVLSTRCFPPASRHR